MRHLTNVNPCAKIWRSFGLMLLLMIGITAKAEVIGFETTSSGGAPSDDATVTGLFDAGGGTVVTFGFDTIIDASLTIDTLGRFEDRTNLDGAQLVAGGSAYVYQNSTFQNPPVQVDGDNTASDAAIGGHGGDGIGGAWLLRAALSHKGEPTVDMSSAQGFLIVYSDVLPSSASGQIWDVDSNESWRVTAFDSFDSPIGSPLNFLPAAENDGGPSTFSFSNLSSPISKILIVYTSTDANVGFAFDNFNATAAAVPIPAAIWFFGSALGLMGFLLKAR